MEINVYNMHYAIYISKSIEDIIVKRLLWTKIGLETMYIKFYWNWTNRNWVTRTQSTMHFFLATWYILTKLQVNFFFTCFTPYNICQPRRILLLLLNLFPVSLTRFWSETHTAIHQNLTSSLYLQYWHQTTSFKWPDGAAPKDSWCFNQRCPNKWSQ